MIDLPAWLKKDLHKYRCPQCQKVMDEKGILGVGIKVSSKYKEKTVFFFDFLCSCEYKIIVELDFMTIEDFVSDMVQEYTEGIDEEIDENIISKEKEKEKEKEKVRVRTPVISKIEDDEYDEMIEDLKNCEYWDDFLLKLGFSSSEIKQQKQDGIKEFHNWKNGA